MLVWVPSVPLSTQSKTLKWSQCMLSANHNICIISSLRSAPCPFQGRKELLHNHLVHLMMLRCKQRQLISYSTQEQPSSEWRPLTVAGQKVSEAGGPCLSRETHGRLFVCLRLWTRARVQAAQSLTLLLCPFTLQVWASKNVISRSQWTTITTTRKKSALKGLWWGGGSHSLSLWASQLQYTATCSTWRGPSS